MTTITLTPEMGAAFKQAIERSGGHPVRVEDPSNQCAYIVHIADSQAEPPSPGERGQPPLFDVPEGIRRSQAAFLRDLPELLDDKSLRGQWVVYNGDERVGIDPDDAPLLAECARRGLKHDDYEIFVIEETEEVDYPSAWMA